MTIISDGQLDKVLISQSVKFKDGLELHMVAGGVILCPEAPVSGRAGLCPDSCHECRETISPLH